VAYYSLSPTYGGSPFLCSSSRLDAIPLYPLTLSKGHVMGNAFTLNFPVSDALDIKSITAVRALRTNAAPHGVGTGDLKGLVTNFVTTGVQTVTPYDTILGPDQTRPDPTRQRQVSEELQISGQIGRHKYVGGFYYFSETYGEDFYYLSTLTSEVIPSLPPNVAVNDIGGGDFSGKSVSYAGYISDSYTPPILGDRLEITGGIRYTVDQKTLDYLADALIDQSFAHHYKQFSDVSGDATVKYQWTPDLMTYLHFANAYKSGGFNARSPETSPGFNPETADNFELGVKADILDSHMRTNADVFYTKYDNKQVDTFIVANDQVYDTVANAASVRYVGSEVEVTIVPARHWDIDLSVGQTWPKYLSFEYQPVYPGPVYNIASSARFPNFSKTSAAIGDSYTFDPMPMGELSMRADFTYKSGMYFAPSDTFNARNEELQSGAQTLLNFNISLAHIPVGLQHGDLKVAAYCSNCLDKEFRTQGADFGVLGVGVLVYNRPRVFGLNLTATY
jgi:iron complex outermembrane recepter protein